MSATVGYRLTAKGYAAMAELRERYAITDAGRAAIGATASAPDVRCAACGAWLTDEARCQHCGRHTP